MIRPALCLIGALSCLALSACATTGGEAPASVAGTASTALSAGLCDRPRVHDAGRQDRLLRFAALVRETLDSSGRGVAIVSRTGVDLERIGVRFSHSGVTIRSGDGVRWTVRQLYYACDEGRPRLYDQGITGFLFNTDDATSGHVSIVFPASEDAARLQEVALDRPRALRLLAARYSANAYPFSVLYQNCNQWVAELLATAWGELPDGPDLRQRAQTWLTANGYSPPTLELGSHWLKAAAALSPMVHLDDHPESVRNGLRLQVSLPESIEGFVRSQPGDVRRVELCFSEDRVVIREGWRQIAKGCVADEGDQVHSLAPLARVD